MNDVAAFGNPYTELSPERAQAWESGWNEASKTREVLNSKKGLTLGEKEKIKVLHAEARSYHEIAQELKRSPRIIKKYLAQVKAPTREGWLAFRDDVPVSDNPYRESNEQKARAWESGWRDAQKYRESSKASQGKTSDQVETAIDIVGKGLGWIIGIGGTIGVLIVLGIALFGGWFGASESVMNDTAKTQGKLSATLYRVFNEFGRLDVREDCSVRVYISKRGYMQVPYPDRDEAVRTIGKAWCEDKEIGRWRLPRVVLRDIQTGEEFGSYGCLTGWVSNK